MPRWKLIGAILLHSVLPIWLLALIADAVIAGTGGESVASLLHGALVFSLWFVPIYTAVSALIVAATALAEALIGSRRRRGAAEAAARPEAQSAARVAQATAARLGESADALLRRIAAARWDHEDSRFQALARDLAALVATSGEALDRAAPEAARDIGSRAATALSRIDAELLRLTRESEASAQDAARTVTNYVELRYGDEPTDSTGKAT
jgi:hypothetical protein